MPTSDGFITTDDGARLFFQKVENGPTTVFVLNGTFYLDDFQSLANKRTVIFLDLRNRGRSDFITDASKLTRGIHQDVDDLETVRRHFGLDQLNLIGHSYTGLIVMLYAIKYASRAKRIVQIGPIGPDGTKQYPSDLMNADATLRDFFSKIQALEKERATTDPVEFCRKFWTFLRVIYVTNPADAGKIKFERCDLKTECFLMKYWMENLQPSVQAVKLTAADLAGVKASVLTIHGTKDRSAPFGGAVDWASMLPNARLLAIEGAGHAPWIEEPERVFAAIEEFCGG